MPSAAILTEDVFFLAKIKEVADSLAIATEFKSSGYDIVDYCKKNRPELIILDMNAQGAFDAIRNLKKDSELFGVPIVGYLLHTQVQQKMKAKELGCDFVLARSDFSKNLPAILKGEYWK